MKYTNKMIKRILVIQDFLETTNTLYRVYSDFDYKKITKETTTDKQRIYKVLCSSLYNLIVAIKNSNDIFSETKKYNEFIEKINQRYIAEGNKYYSEENYESNLFKIIETIRHQNNHYQRDDDNDTILFEIYVDFKKINELRILLNEIFYEIYNKIDKEKIKQIILSKPKIQYSFDKLTAKVNEIELKMYESKNEIDEVFAEDNKKAIEIVRDILNVNNIYDLLNNDKVAIDKYNLNYEKIKELFDKLDKYIAENENDIQKETMKLLKDFFMNNMEVTKSEYDINSIILCENLKSLNDKNKQN